MLANMLALSDINPFAAREAKVYQEDKEIMAMMEVRRRCDGGMTGGGGGGGGGRGERWRRRGEEKDHQRPAYRRGRAVQVDPGLKPSGFEF